MDNCWVMILSDSSPGVDVGLIRLFSQGKIMEMECEVLISNFKDPKTIALVKENVGQISDGSSSHRASALKLVLKKGFELKKQKRQPSGVFLRCLWSGCGWHTINVPYASIGSNTYCLCCRRSNCMQCTGCSYTRTSAYASCQNCGKTFS